MYYAPNSYMQRHSIMGVRALEFMLLISEVQNGVREKEATIL